MKVGYTNDSLSKRFSGGGLEKGWELVFYEEISEEYNIKDSNNNFGISSINQFSQSLGLVFDINQKGPYTKLLFKR